MNLAQVKRVFEDHKVTSALIIDDVFDQIGTFEDDDLERAFLLIEKDEAVAAALLETGGEIPADIGALEAQLATGAPLSDALNSALRSDTDSPLRQLARAVFAKIADDRIAQARPLETLRVLLSNLGIETATYGSAGPAHDEPRHPLIFMDYFLGPQGPPSVQKSVERVMEIVSRYPKTEPPIVVLMSSQLTRPKLALEFRDESELLGSQFQFVMKGKFGEDGFAFVASLADLVEFSGKTRTIGGFVDAWKTALDHAAHDFIRHVRTLDAEDYYHLHAKLGSGAEHRFGEHVSGLFAGYLRKLVEDRPELQSVTEGMNRLQFDAVPKVGFAPSETVANLSYAASFQDLPPTAREKKAVELGDVFVREVGTGRQKKMEASIVVSQDCDLEHGKTNVVFMIDGDMVPHSPVRLSSDGESRHLLRVDLFQHDGTNYTIEWDARRVRSVPFGNFQAEIVDRNFSRVARLRTVQALALQQKFASHITRVAMPELPPTYRFTAAEVFIRTKTTKRALLDPWTAGKRMACVVGVEKPYASLNLEIFDRVRVALETVNREDLNEDEITKTLCALKDVEVLRGLRSIRLEDSKAQIGTIAIKDSTKPMEAGENLPKGAFLMINLRP